MAESAFESHVVPLRGSKVGFKAPVIEFQRLLVIESLFLVDCQRFGELAELVGLPLRGLRVVRPIQRRQLWLAIFERLGELISANLVYVVEQLILGVLVLVP